MHSNHNLLLREKAADNTNDISYTKAIDILSSECNTVANIEAESSDITVLAPALFGRYLLSDSQTSEEVEASLERSRAFDKLLDHAQKTFSFDCSKNIDIKLNLSSAIYSRDFLVLLGITKIMKTSKLHHKNVDGGFTFLSSDLREILSLTSGGQNIEMIEESLLRLANINISIVATQGDRRETLASEDLFSEYATGGKKVSGRRRQRHWYVALTPLAELIFNFSSIEQTRYNISELIKVRKQPATLAVKAHYQTVDYEGGEVYDKKLYTLAKNCNIEINENLWLTDSKYRNKKSTKLQRVIESLSLVFEKPKRILYMLSSLVALRPKPILSI